MAKCLSGKVAQVLALTPPNGQCYTSLAPISDIFVISGKRS